MLFSVLQFFQKAGVAEALNVFELFNTVSGLEINSDNEADFLAQVWTLNVYFKFNHFKKANDTVTNMMDNKGSFTNTLVIGMLSDLCVQVQS